MYLILRILRAIIGVIAGLQFVGTGDFVRATFIEASPSSSELIILTMRLAILIVHAGAFIGLRKIINYLHCKKFGKPHPALNTPWAL